MRSVLLALAARGCLSISLLKWFSLSPVERGAALLRVRPWLEQLWVLLAHDVSHFSIALLGAPCVLHQAMRRQLKRLCCELPLSVH